MRIASRIWVSNKISPKPKHQILPALCIFVYRSSIYLIMQNDLPGSVPFPRPFLDFLKIYRMLNFWIKITRYTGSLRSIVMGGNVWVDTKLTIICVWGSGRCHGRVQFPLLAICLSMLSTEFRPLSRFKLSRSSRSSRRNLTVTCTRNTHYDSLGVPHSASRSQIKVNFFVMLDYTS